VQLEAFIEKKADLRDADAAWQAYRRVVRAYTIIKLALGSKHSQEASVVYTRISSKGVRHPPVFSAVSGSSGSAPAQQSSSRTLSPGRPDSGMSGASATSQHAQEAGSRGADRLACDAATQYAAKESLDPSDPGFKAADLRRHEASMLRGPKLTYKVDQDDIESRLDSEL
jgi:hypothetical protein